jgi:DNA replication protein DnaC
MQKLKFDLPEQNNEIADHESLENQFDQPRESVNKERSLLGRSGLDTEALPPEIDFSFFVPSLQQTMEGQDEAQRLLSTIQEWTDQSSETKPWLLIEGGMGIGKTELLRSAVWQMSRNGLSPYYITAYEFDARIKQFRTTAENANSEIYVDPDEWVQKLSRLPILVMDDVGAGVRDSEYVVSRFERLFATRYQLRLPTLVSTNLTSERFKRTVGPRVYSRFTDTGLGRIIELNHCHDVRPFLDSVE